MSNVLLKLKWEVLLQYKNVLSVQTENYRKRKLNLTQESLSFVTSYQGRSMHSSSGVIDETA